MKRIDVESIGRPEGEHHHLRLRRTAAVVAAVAGGAAFVLASLAIMGTIGPAESAGLWAAIVVAGLVWLTGLWWRWDAPDARTHTDERERRGF
jgi:hypothetical protein